MSELTVTGELIASMRSTLLGFDEDAVDAVKYAQYLAALMAIAVADLSATPNQLRDLHGQLASFSYDILQQQLHARQPAREETDPSMIKSGVWKPEK